MLFLQNVYDAFGTVLAINCEKCISYAHVMGKPDLVRYMYAPFTTARTFVTQVLFYRMFSVLKYVQNVMISIFRVILARNKLCADL